MFKERYKEHPRLEEVDLYRVRLEVKNAANYSLAMTIYLLPVVLDLGMKILFNTSKRLFVTSDNPVIISNQYLHGAGEFGTGGFALRGLQIIFPVNPLLLIMFYDENVYRVGSNKCILTEISAPEEIGKLNEMQWVNALENIYYPEGSNEENIRSDERKYLRVKRTERMSIESLPVLTPPGKTEMDIIKLQRDAIDVKYKPKYVKIRRRWRSIHLNKRIPEVRDPELIGAIQMYNKRNKDSFHDLKNLMVFLSGYYKD